MMIIDSVTLVLVLFLSFSARLGYWFWPEDDLFFAIVFAPIIAIPIFIWFGLYREIIRYISFSMLWVVIQAVSLFALIWGILSFMIAIEGIPRSVILINWLFAFVFISGLRIVFYWLLSGIYNKSNLNSKNIIIYGAGSAGRQLSIALRQSNDYNSVAFVDDEVDIQNHSIGGIKVISPDHIKNLIKRKNITEVWLAMPSIQKSRRRAILNSLQNYPLHVRSLPSVSQLAKGTVKIADLQDLSIKDLLGRDLILASKELLGFNIENKVVMVTGAGGSIGSELCRQIFLLKPKLLVLFEINELNLYLIEEELLKLGNQDIRVFPILGSVNKKNLVYQVCKKFKVQTIYHAAAYKHVPMVEFNNCEGVNNNIFGTLNCAQAAINANVNTFVLISTDKAVRPTNTMGASKRFAELILQALSVNQSSTLFTMVRFGNVLGSSGSVIPLFKSQIKNGGPITITDSKMVRYFMTIPESVELVIQAGAMANGGDVFVLDMGEPVSILDLAKKMIYLSGLDIKDETNPDGDIEIIYTGLRPGEKLYEELLIGGKVSKTNNEMIMRAEEQMLSWENLEEILIQLEEEVNNLNAVKIRDLLLKAIPEFMPQSDITDILYTIDHISDLD